MTLIEINNDERVRGIITECGDRIAEIIGEPAFLHLYLKTRLITEEDILHELFNLCGVTSEQVKSSVKTNTIVMARHIFCYFNVLFRKKQKTETARFLNKDHATVIHSLKLVQNMIDTDDPEYIYYVKAIKDKLFALTFTYNRKTK